MASRVVAKIGSGEGPWVLIDSNASWLWELIEPFGCKVFAECVDSEGKASVLEVFHTQPVPQGTHRVKVKAANANASLTVTLVRQPDAPVPD